MADALDASAVVAIEKIARDAEAQKLGKANAERLILGRTYANLAGFTEVESPEPKPSSLDLTTLQGLVDYVRDDPDAAFSAGKKRFLHIVDPVTVDYMTGAGGPYMRRATIAQAAAEVPEITWGAGQPIETFLVALRTLFVRTAAVDQVVDWLSNVDASNSIRLSDDGMSQLLTVNRGVRGKAEVKIPNPILLQPFRTFSAVTQPESPFLLRLHDRGLGNLPMVSITEADLGQWRLAAIANIKTFLADALPGVAVYG